MASPSRVAVDEKQIEVDGEKKWLYAAVDVDSKLLLEVDVYSRRRSVPRRRFYTTSPKNTILPMHSFSSMLVAI